MTDLSEQISEQIRVNELQRRFYAREVRAGRMTPAEADSHLDCLIATLETLTDRQRQEQAEIDQCKPRIYWPAAWDGVQRISWRSLRKSNPEINYDWILGGHSETQYVEACLTCLPATKRRSVVLRIWAMAVNYQKQRTERSLQRHE
jgi:hypothetical protein